MHHLQIDDALFSKNQDWLLLPCTTREKKVYVSVHNDHHTIFVEFVSSITVCMIKGPARGLDDFRHVAQQ